MSADQPQNEAEAIQPRVVSYFAIYPDPIGLSSKGSHCVIMDPRPIVGFPKSIVAHVEAQEDPIRIGPPFSEYPFVSVRFHRGRRERGIIDTHMAELMAVVDPITGTTFRPAKPNTSDPSSQMPEPDGYESESDETADDWENSYTVVEMTTPVVVPTASAWQPSAPIDQIMGPLLTRAIGGFIRIVNAYRFGNKIYMPSPARERMGPLIFTATRSAESSEGGWDYPGSNVINFFAIPRQPIGRDSDDEHSAKQMRSYLTFEAIDHPSLAIGQLQSEMNTAFLNEGNFRATLIFAHSADEVMLDTALMGMLYEEGETPDEAARRFDKPLKTRVLTEYHERLGGSWTPKGSGAVAIWLRDLLTLRHRVAHTGYMPTFQEAQAARKAHDELAKHVRNRLAAHAKTYPFIAGMLLTARGFERRGIHTKAAQNAIDSSGLEAVKQFVEWRSELVRSRS